MSEVKRSSLTGDCPSNAVMIGRLVAVMLALALDIAIAIGAWWALSN